MIDVNSFLKFSEPTKLGEMFKDYGDRFRFEARLRPDAKHTRHEDYVYDGEEGIKQVVMWLAGMAVLHPEAVVVCENDFGLTVREEITRPYTEEELQEARDWLEANPTPELNKTTIKWRRFVPFNKGE